MPASFVRKSHQMTKETASPCNSNDDLRLPPPRVLDRHIPTGIALHGYSAEDMRAYAAKLVAAERERSDGDREGPDPLGWHAKDYARAIRGV